MSRFFVEPAVLRRDADVLGRIVQRLGAQNDVLVSVTHDDFASGSAYNTVMERLRSISRQITDGQSIFLSQQSALSSIAEVYDRTENSILGSLVGNNERRRAINKNLLPLIHSDDDDDDIDWFKEGSLGRLFVEMYEVGVISAPLLAKFYLANLIGDYNTCQEAVDELIDELLAEGQADLLALAPRYLSNEGFIAIYEALRTGDANGNPYVEKILDYYSNSLSFDERYDHYSSNRSLLPTVYTQGDFIENQAEWGAILYGKDTNYALVEEFTHTSNMSYSGCEVIAVANALNNLGANLSCDDMALLMGYFENNGIALNGVIGTSPMALYEYMSDKGYDASYTLSTDVNEINNFGGGYDTFIVTGYNDANDITRSVHTVCITKNPDGTFAVHNGYQTDSTGNWIEAGPFIDLNEAVRHIVQNGDPEPIMITGVGN